MIAELNLKILIIKFQRAQDIGRILRQKNLANFYTFDYDEISLLESKQDTKCL